MSPSLITAAVLLAAEEGGEPAIAPWIVGLIVMGLLVSLLAVVVSVGGGREHS